MQYFIEIFTPTKFHEILHHYQQRQSTVVVIVVQNLVEIDAVV